MDRNAAVGTLLAFIRRHNNPMTHWYAGITNNPIRRVFIEHQVPLDYPYHMCIDAPSADDARAIEAFFIRRIGTDGGGGGGDQDARFVYVFLKAKETDPPLT